MGTAARWVLVLAGLAILAAGAYVSFAQSGSGAQPWDPELSDNFDKDLRRRLLGPREAPEPLP